MKTHQTKQQGDLFNVDLFRIVVPKHELSRLTKVVDWDRLDELIGSAYFPDMVRVSPALA